MRVILSILLPFLFLSCENFAQSTKGMSPEQFEVELKKGNVQLLDVRTAAEFQTGHLQGALQADWNNQSQFEERTKYLDKNKPVYIYCLSGARSANAAKYLEQKGFKEMAHLTGGLMAWKKSGRAVAATQKKTETTPEDYQHLISASSLVLVDFGAEWCPPCKKMEPVLATFMEAQKGKLTLIKMDGGTEEALMKRERVDALPTFIVYKNGRETARKQGVLSNAELLQLIQ